MFAMKELAALCKKIENGTLVEVVRCRECRWGLVGKQNVICMKHSPVVPRTHDFDYYCSDGERKGREQQ